MIIEQYFNVFEGCFWIVMGVGLYIYNHRKRVVVFKHNFGLGFILVMFGISDFIEVTTGAWYRPWWLFVMKAICVVGLFGAIYVYVKVYKPLK